MVDAEGGVRVRNMKRLVGLALGSLLSPSLVDAETLDFSAGSSASRTETRAAETAPLPAAAPDSGTGDRVDGAEAAAAVVPSSTATPASSTATPAAPARESGRTVTHRPLAAAPEVCQSTTPDGFYLRVVTGTALLWMRGVNPTGTSSRMFTGAAESTIAIGGAVAKGWVLAGTLHAIEGVGELSNGPFEDTQVTVGGQSITLSERAYAGSSLLGAMVDWYPNPRGGWHVGLAAGLGATNLMLSADDTTLFSTGLGGMVAGGYDWRLGRDFWLGLSLQASGVMRGTMKDEDGRDTRWRMKSFGIGIGSSLVYF